ncbi:hypothetical protein [Saccharothrix sp. Mg75]|uniref:hypothetical protein n=1 Tax=Saccharothrix sp. Mg75 TaxID=3445357 RepID=UPI003EEF96C0
MATFPTRVNGTLVADAAFNVNVFTRLDARLRDHPVTVDVVDSTAVDFTCASPDVSRLLELCRDLPHARRVGELGFGTNSGVTSLIPMNSHINERVPGVHIGFGQHNQDIKIVDYFCEIHLDLIAFGGLVTTDVDDEPVDLAEPRDDGSPHPDGVNDEDIDGDCCALTVEQCLVLREN